MRSTTTDKPPRRDRSFPTDSFDSLSVHFPEGAGRRGVYILTFEDESRYVGQSVDVVGRCAAHRRRWDDITSVAFAEVAPGESLDTAEREVIAAVARDHEVRNIALVAHVTIPSPTVSTVIEPAELIDWFAVGPGNEHSARLDDVDHVAQPKGKDRLLLAASVARHGFTTEDTDAYAQAGTVTRLWFDDLSMLERMMESKVITRLARNLTVSLMFKGRTSYGRYHDFNLADHVI